MKWVPICAVCCVISVEARDIVLRFFSLTHALARITKGEK
jgi:hypothetical protein